jgi:hypothetical protein
VVDGVRGENTGEEGTSVCDTEGDRIGDQCKEDCRGEQVEER